MTILKRGHSFPSKKMWKESWYRAKKHVSQCIRWTTKSSYGLSINSRLMSCSDTRIKILSLWVMPSIVILCAISVCTCSSAVCRRLWNAYLESNDFSAIDAVKRNILELYIDDFRKIDPTGRASRLFTSIPAELSRNTTRYKVGSVIENATAARLSELLMDMADSMTVNFAYHANDPSVGFSLHADYDYFKMFLADTGLFVTLCFYGLRLYGKCDIPEAPFLINSVQIWGMYTRMQSPKCWKSAGNELFYYTFKEETVKDEEENKTVRS